MKHVFFAAALALCGSHAMADGATRTVTDTSGAEVVIPANPTRIAIAADRAFTEPFVAIGMIPIAAASHHEFAPYLVEALGGLDDLADLGGHNDLDFEALATAAPDLIVIRNITKNGKPAFLEKASLIAPTVQLDSTVSMRDLIDDMGDILGREHADKMHGMVDDAIARMAAAVPDPSAIKVSHGSIYSDGRVSLFKDNSNLASQLIRAAGYARPESQTSGKEEIENDSTTISLERLDLLDGDILFLNMIGSDAELAPLRDSPLWAHLDVVKRDALIQSDWRAWNNGGALAAQLIADEFIAGLKATGLAE